MEQAFQFHKGTIRTGIDAGSKHIGVYFNSIKVQLEQSYFSAHALETYYFNSIKVQLELAVSVVYYTLQSHFNSIKVQLEPLRSTMVAHLPVYFNSIKVQLEQSVLYSSDSAHQFQFHKGTIRTR